jgi:aryl sulfotransferase
VSRTIWLASYPKSGNTWMRALLGNILAEDGGPAGLDALLYGGASERFCFDFVMLVDSGLLTHDEIDCLRPRAYKAIACGDFDDCFAKTKSAAPVRFVKVHDAYSMTPAGEPLLGGLAGAYGAIVIVRDPRDVAPSWAHHLGVSIDDAIATMSSDGTVSNFYTETNSQEMQFRQKLRGWSTHVASWLDQTDVPVHLVRYEDLLKDTAGTLSGALAFAGVAVSMGKINRAVASCDFVCFRAEEERNGFVEAPRRGIKFFRRGRAGGWHDDLTCEQVIRIESRHGRMMRRLGYEPSHASDLARTG